MTHVRHVFDYTCSNILICVLVCPFPPFVLFYFSRDPLPAIVTECNRTRNDSSLDCACRSHHVTLSDAVTVTWTAVTIT